MITSPILNATNLTRTPEFPSPPSIAHTPRQADNIFGFSHFERPLGEFNYETVQTPNHAFKESISWLIQLIKEKEHMIGSNSLAQLRGDMQALLSYVQTVESLYALSRMPGLCYNYGTRALSQLSLVNNLLLAAPEVEMNSNGTIQRSLSKIIQAH